MKLDSYVEDIKLMLTGGLLELEIPDSTIAQIVNKSLREVQKYIDIPKFVTVPFSRCIDLTNWKHQSIVKIYRTSSYGDPISPKGSMYYDPLYAQQWTMFNGGGNMYNLDNYLTNFMSYTTLLQIRNTLSTDLAFKEDKEGNKLYINCLNENPMSITIEYIPVYDNVEEIEDDYWTDIIEKLAIAQTKIVLGRIRSHVKQSNALWTLDGDTLLQEGNTELTELRTRLNDNLAMYYPVD